MKVSVISVGKLKERYLKEGIGEYTKRLSVRQAVASEEAIRLPCSMN